MAWDEKGEGINWIKKEENPSITKSLINNQTESKDLDTYNNC